MRTNISNKFFNSPILLRKSVLLHYWNIYKYIMKKNKILLLIGFIIFMVVILIVMIDISSKTKFPGQINDAQEEVIP
ncbi:hypothetical protein AUTU_16990 [Aureibacter tunicatorum]|nr:hypothetical protein AUTU_16990 [Aureibacter tunicatorum]